MSQLNDVAGRVGDVSGRVGDVSGRVGDVSGRVFDFSGVAGRVGDVSGRTLEEIQAVMLQDRQSDRIAFLENKVHRLENEMFGLAQWLDARVRMLEDNLPEDLGKVMSLNDQRVGAVERKSASIQDSLTKLDERLKKLEPRP